MTRGTSLGPYEVIEPIAVGGMGQVYRAVDRRLNRSVAIKVIADPLREHPGLRDRFKSEAALIAALNHPHICQLYDVGAEQGIDFLVMELLQGETLAARLQRGRLPLDLALRMAGEMADALDAAHRRGIVHRDLKPANVMVTPTGIKLLDFGIARLLVPDVASLGAAATQAASARLTNPGSPLGTWSYMAPEQMQGHDADARSDVFALGAVIYEMVTGRRAFDAPTHQALVVAVLDAEPAPMRTVIPALPSSLDSIVRICLSKNPEERWQSAGDVHRALVALSTPSDVPVGASRRSRAWIAGLSVLILGAAALGALVANRTQPPTAGRQELRTSILLEPGQQLVAGVGAVAMSPDGSTIVYEAAKAGVRQLFRRRLSDRADAAIAGSEGGSGPFFSPDGQWVGFTNRGQLLKVPLAGGAATLLVQERETEYHGAWWADDGRIVASLDSRAGLVSIPAGGGAITPLTTLDVTRGEDDHRWPQVLPGGAVLFTVGTGPSEDVRIDIQDSRTGHRRELVRGSASARYVATGHLVFARRGALMAAPFDLQRLELTGAAVEIAQGVAERPDGAPEYSFSRAGDLVFVAGPSGGPQNELMWVDQEGNAQPLGMPRAAYYSPRLSPDGDRVALTLLGGRNDVSVYDLARGTSTRLATGRKHQAVWTPDGARVVFAFGKPGSENLFWQLADGSGVAERLTTSDRPQLPRSWSPDGRTLAFVQHDAPTDWDVWTLSRDGSPPRPFLQSKFSEDYPRFSPNGRWIAYSSDESGRPEVYVRPYPNGEGRWAVSAEGGLVPVWSPDGRQLFFRFRDGLWAADVTTAGTFTASKPRLLFRRANTAAQFDIAPDATRFLMVAVDPAQNPTHLQLVLGWARGVTSQTTR